MWRRLLCSAQGGGEVEERKEAVVHGLLLGEFKLCRVRDHWDRYNICVAAHPKHGRDEFPIYTENINTEKWTFGPIFLYASKSHETSTDIFN